MEAAEALDGLHQQEHQAVVGPPHLLSQLLATARQLGEVTERREKETSSQGARGGRREQDELGIVPDSLAAATLPGEVFLTGQQLLEEQNAGGLEEVRFPQG